MEDVTGERRKLHSNDFRLPPPCKRDLHSSWMLSRTNLYFVTDVLGQPIGPTFRSQAVQDCSIISGINIFSLPEVFRLLKPRKVGWAEHVVRREEKYKSYSGKIPTRCSFVIESIIPKFFKGSTCFERHTAHHQEL
jgi:hypothetical protein